MDIIEPIYVTEGMLRRWGACVHRFEATRLFEDGRIPVTPEGLDVLLAQRQDARGWVGHLLSTPRRRALFRLGVEADMRTAIAADEGARHLAVDPGLTLALHRYLAELRTAHWRIAPTKEELSRVAYLEAIYSTLGYFRERWPGRDTFAGIASQYARLNVRRAKLDGATVVITVDEATRRVFAHLCAAIYPPRPDWRTQPRQPNGRFARRPPPVEHEVDAPPRLPQPLVDERPITTFRIEDLPVVGTVRPDWTRQGYLVTTNGGATWATTVAGNWAIATTSTAVTAWSVPFNEWLDTNGRR